MKNFIKERWPDMLLGVVFVVSGFVKAVDPVGLSYKIEEYLGMFQLSGWSGLSMLLSVLLCAAELTLGLLLLLRLWRKLTAVVVTLCYDLLFFQLFLLAAPQCGHSAREFPFSI